MRKQLAGYILALSLGCALGMSDVEAAKQPVKPAVEKQTKTTVKAKNPLAKYKTADGRADYQVTMRNIGGKPYLFDAKGRVYRRQYLSKVGLHYYYFNKDHSLKLRWLKRKDGTLYFNNQTGQQVRNTIQEDFGTGKFYYFDASGKQRTKQGWHTLTYAGKKYKILVKKDGSLQTGTYRGAHGNRLFTRTGLLVENGITRVSAPEDDETYHPIALAKNGEWMKRQGWYELDGKRYLVKQNGTLMKSTSIRYGTHTYYFNDCGELRVNETVIVGKNRRQMLDEKGDYVTKPGFYTARDRNGKAVGPTVYVKKDGYLQEGWMTRNGKRYYFSYGVMLKDGAHQVGNKFYYFDRNGVRQNYRGEKTIGGLTYKFRKDHSVQTGVYTHGKKRQVSQFGSYNRGFGYAESMPLTDSIKKGLVPETVYVKTKYGTTEELKRNSRGNLSFVAYDGNGNRRNWTGKHEIRGYVFNFDKSHRVRGDKTGLNATRNGKKSPFYHESVLQPGGGMVCSATGGRYPSGERHQLCLRP